MSEQNKEVYVKPENLIKHMVKLIGEIKLTADQANMMVVGLSALDVDKAMDDLGDRLQEDQSKQNVMKYLCADAMMHVMSNAVKAILPEGRPDLKNVNRLVAEAADEAGKQEANERRKDLN